MPNTLPGSWLCSTAVFLNAAYRQRNLLLNGFYGGKAADLSIEGPISSLLLLPSGIGI
jgi:hypothetical protein